jgi:hypothetical protein
MTSSRARWLAFRLERLVSQQEAILSEETHSPTLD